MVIGKRSVVLLLSVSIASGCTPTLKYSGYKPAVSSLSHFDGSDISKTIAVAALTDARPSPERFSKGSAVWDFFFICLTWGLGWLLMRSDPGQRPQFISGVGYDIRDYLVRYIKETNLFKDVIGLPQTTKELSNNIPAITGLRKKADFVLIGEVKRLYGDWTVGQQLSREDHSFIPTQSSPYYAGEITYTYALTNCHGVTYLSLKMVDTSDGKEVWSQDINTYWSCDEQGVSIQPYIGDIPERNRLAAKSFELAIPEVIDALKNWEKARRKDCCDQDLRENVVPEGNLDGAINPPPQEEEIVKNDTVSIDQPLSSLALPAEPKLSVAENQNKVEEERVEAVVAENIEGTEAGTVKRTGEDGTAGQPDETTAPQDADIQLLIRQLEDKDWNIRKTAAYSLGARKASSALEPLIAALQDEYWAVQKAAAVALRQIKDARAVEPLIVLLKNKDAIVRNAAIEALTGIQDTRAVDPLIALLGDQDAAVRKRAVRALGEFHDARAVPELMRVVGTDRDADVRIGAAEAVAKIKEKNGDSTKN